MEKNNAFESNVKALFCDIFKGYRKTYKYRRGAVVFL